MRGRLFTCYAILRAEERVSPNAPTHPYGLLRVIRSPPVAADAAAHGPKSEACKKQAADLLDQAEKASPPERSEIEKMAADLLAPSAK
jgi:hypothetical protein